MGTKALMILKFEDEEIHAISKFNGEDFLSYLRDVKDMGYRIEEIRYNLRVYLTRALYLTLDEIGTMLEEFSESQQALDALWLDALQEKFHPLNMSPLFQWNKVYPTMAFDVKEVFNALLLSSPNRGIITLTPILKLSEQELITYKYFVPFVYEINVDSNSWCCTKWHQEKESGLLTEVFGEKWDNLI